MHPSRRACGVDCPLNLFSGRTSLPDLGIFIFPSLETNKLEEGPGQLLESYLQVLNFSINNSHVIT